MREYTVLLDPSNYSMASPSANIVQDVPSYADNNLSSRYRGNAAPIARPQPGILKVKSGSTLRGLAGKVRPRGATLDQTMAALAQANPDAFVDGDVSRLKLGAVLKVPTSRKIKSLSASQVASILAGSRRRQQPRPRPAPMCSSWCPVKPAAAMPSYRIWNNRWRRASRP